MAIERRPDGPLAGKVAVITGAGKGIGAATAALFVEQGATVLVADIDGSEEAVAAALAPHAAACRCDVRDEAAVEAMFKMAQEKLGAVDILANFAGNPGGKRGDEVTVEEIDDLTSVHLRGTLLTNKFAVRAMKAGGKGGAIVNISSAAAMGASAGISPVYGAVKAGINTATKYLAHRHGRDGIRVNSVIIGFTLSERNTRAPEHIQEALMSGNALGRAGAPREQAEVVAFLASDRASFMTGANVPVDGGWTARLA